MELNYQFRSPLYKDLIPPVLLTCSPSQRETDVDCAGDLDSKHRGASCAVRVRTCTECARAEALEGHLHAGVRGLDGRCREQQPAADYLQGRLLALRQGFLRRPADWQVL